MAYIRRVITTLRTNGPMCDDCLSSATKITPRQSVAMLAMDLSRAGRVLRKKTTCPQCGRIKRCSGIPKSQAAGAAKKKGFFARLFGAKDDG